DHEAAFRAAFPGKIVDTITYSSEASALKPVALKLRNYEFDLLYIPDALPLAQGLLKELEKIGIRKQAWSVYSAELPDIISANGSAANGLIYSYPDIGEGNPHSYFAAQCMKQLLGAISLCRDDPDCVRSALIKEREESVESRNSLKLRAVKAGRFVDLN
ncbi:MAG: hypothetical protein DCC75_02790, partial [Proteobacteria bacterium]